MSAVAAPAPAARVERWTWLSGGFTVALAGLVALLAFGPVLWSENALNNLIQLFAFRRNVTGTTPSTGVSSLRWNVS